MSGREHDGAAPTIGADALAARARGVLSAAGVPPRAAEVVAESLVDADLRGVHSHGVNRLGIYLQRMAAGGNVADAEAEAVLDAPALAVLDARDGLSQVASARAVELAAEKARAAGSATVLVRGGSHFGAAGYWARRLAERGFVALVTTNTSSLMAAWGGTTTAIGTNPVAMAFPSAELPPVVVDVATSEATWGRLVNAAAAGEAIPEGWALDEQGRPTTDAAAAVAARRMLPFGRHKGYALAVGVELLSGALAGASCLAAIGDMYAEAERPMGAGHLFVAIDATRIAAPDGRSVADQVTAVQRAVNGLPGAGGGRVLWPGQLEHELAAQRARDGIPLPAQIERDLRALEEARR